MTASGGNLSIGAATTTATSQSEEKVSSALKAEEKLQSLWYILHSDGMLTPINEYKFKNQQKNLHALANYEMAKKESSR